jgi:hypothetical protein
MILYNTAGMSDLKVVDVVTEERSKGLSVYFPGAFILDKKPLCKWFVFQTLLGLSYLP